VFVLSPCKGKEIIHQTQTLSGRVLNENEVLSLFENQSNYKKDNAYVFFLNKHKRRIYNNNKLENKSKHHLTNLIYLIYTTVVEF